MNNDNLTCYYRIFLDKYNNEYNKLKNTIENKLNDKIKELYKNYKSLSNNKPSFTNNDIILNPFEINYTIKIPLEYYLNKKLIDKFMLFDNMEFYIEVDDNYYIIDYEKLN